MPSPADSSTASSPPSLGEQELDILRFVTDHAPTTARIVAEDWGQPHGLAKSTVLTVIERLRAKGYLTRTKQYGSFVYSPSLPKGALFRQLIHEFVERALGGSSSPLVQYLIERRDLTPEEFARLEELVAQQEADVSDSEQTMQPEKRAQTKKAKDTAE